MLEFLSFFSKYLLHLYCGSGTMQGSGNMVANELVMGPEFIKVNVLVGDS